jgi:hypothetical protein
MLNYHRGIHLTGLTDEAIDSYVDLGAEIALVSSPTTQAILFRHGGAVSQIPDDATAAGHRGAAYMAHPIAAWQDPAQTELHLDWVRKFSEAMAPFTTGGVYLNFEPDEGEERVRAGYGQQVRKARGAEGQVGSRQPVPGQPEHQTQPRHEGARSRLIRVRFCRPAALARVQIPPYAARWPVPHSHPQELSRPVQTHPARF